MLACTHARRHHLGILAHRVAHLAPPTGATGRYGIQRKGELTRWGSNGIARGATERKRRGSISKPPPSATRPPLQQLHGRHLTRVPTSTQAGSARVAESLIGRGDPFIRAAELSQFGHKIRRLRYAPGRRGMPVTPITMQRYPARSPSGTALAPAARHDADRGGADRAGGTRRMAHAVGRPEGPEDT